MAIALMLVPSLRVVMRPLGMIGIAVLGIRLITLVVNNPTQQEKDLIRQLQGYLGLGQVLVFLALGGYRKISAYLPGSA